MSASPLAAPVPRYWQASPHRFLELISHCIDDDMMTFDYESVFRSSCVGLVLWAVRLVSFEKLTL